MKRNRIKLGLAALLCGGVPLVTSATCDPYAGVLDFYRDDDGGYYDSGYWVEDVYYVDYYDDCGWWACY
ncbi:MAG: hypothetical protein AABZ12_07340 [Planctomycetota bacterium]